MDDINDFDVGFLDNFVVHGDFIPDLSTDECNEEFEFTIDDISGTKWYANQAVGE